MTSKPAGFTAMTFNIRYDTSDDGLNAWRHRRSLVLATIGNHKPDLLGIQEALDSQRDDIADAFPECTAFGAAEAASVCLDDLPRGFVRAARFEPLTTGVFWLSDTPDVAGSATWSNDGGARLCCWARVHDRLTNRALVFATTHFDTNADAWLRSARTTHLGLDKIAGNLPIVLVGDFNCAAGSEAHRYLCADAGYRDAWNEAGHSDEQVITFNGFSPYRRLPEDDELENWLGHTSAPHDRLGHYPPHIRTHRNYRIDWILVRGAIATAAAENDYRTEKGRLPSDHYPVIAQLEWRQTG